MFELEKGIHKLNVYGHIERGHIKVHTIEINCMEMI